LDPLNVVNNLRQAEPLWLFLQAMMAAAVVQDPAAIFSNSFLLALLH
jgi:hypothetical protein